MIKYLIALLSLAGCTEAYAQQGGHAYINSSRTDGTHVFFQQSLDGEYGKYHANDGTELWKGYSLGTSVGLETFKFVQLVAGHRLINLKNTGKLETLNGSRLYGGGRLSFLSPVGNLELGAGVQGSRLDYQKDLYRGSFYGSGIYWSLGVNYFLSNQFSVYYEASQTREHMQGGTDAGTETKDGNSMLMGLGFRIWL